MKLMRIGLLNKKSYQFIKNIVCGLFSDLPIKGNMLNTDSAVYGSKFL